MLTKIELEKYCSQLGFTIWQAERDYLQHLVLLFLFKRIGDELIWKGGTALQKTFGLNRFSIDLDFTQTKELPPTIFSLLAKDCGEFGFPTTVTEELKTDSLKVKLSLQGPLYQGTERTLTILRVEISRREKVLLKPEIKEIFPLYADLQPYLTTVMNLQEIAAEKVRAILTRNKARDVFDLRFLLQKKVTINEQLIPEKMKGYAVRYSKAALREAIQRKKKIWNSELTQLITDVPRFEEVLAQIEERS